MAAAGEQRTGVAGAPPGSEFWQRKLAAMIVADCVLTRGKMIDNNDFVTEEALGLPPDEPMVVEEEDVEMTPEDATKWMTPEVKSGEGEKNFLDGNELQNALQDEYLSAVVKNLEEDEYLLVVDGAAICSGPMDEIQEQARALVFGEHPLCGGNPMPIDDIIVLKRTKVKVGLFLE